MGFTMDMLEAYFGESGMITIPVDPKLRERLRAAKPKPKTQVRITPKVGRNDLCPCGSGKKFKKCCDN